ncbi:type 2 lanthipeptide synthetase LanM family protein [Actinomadura xylanilytica]|uniref:type 2 lanthipeptide synthetase LanM family protein n=1 Tax=Actinomadura xylanilytica TaxID=887459 RepID=UPI00255AAC5D|nr:type 2 lanthipeptide synthetase LanM family protein [Actinomadura xylanilytica]MDL4771039.1 type 2 lanthipeptide synthetase LanM family protein [Actinomadura xylanilytica]
MTTAPARRDAGIPWQRAVRGAEAPGPAEPEWHRRFRIAWESPADGAGLPADLGLLEAARPLIADARRTLRECLLTDLGPDGPDGLPGVLVREPPLGWLTMAVQPALARELAAVRAGDRPEGGATPQERYAAFTRGLRDPASALAVWAAYPVLARQVVEMLDDWVAARLAFARDLTADLDALAAAFGTADPQDDRADRDGRAAHDDRDGRTLGPLVDVAFGAAETHRGGRSVALVRFERATVVYKPRSLAVDLCFDRLLGWFNAAAPAHALRRPVLLDRGDRGWSEYITAEPCPEAGLPGYFWRIGALLALTHAVHGYDLHADNVIAAGADPVVIDLEALFHTERTRPMLERARLGDPAAGRLDGSVLRTGLLPGPLVMPDVGTERPFGVDISPLGTAAVRRSLIPTPIVEDPGTDRMRVGLGYRTVPPPAGRLRLPDGSTADPRRHRDDLVAGYTFAYRRLAATGPGLLARGGPLDGCADVQVRLIQLSTFLYVRLLLESWRPDALRDAAARERGLDRLAAGWPGVPHRDALVAAEKAALWRGEVPVFEIRPGHHDVWLEDGTRLPGVLTVSPLEEIAARLAEMGPDDLAAQTDVIDASLSVLEDAPHPTPRPAPAPGPRPTTGGGTALDEAVRIARRLDETAVRAGDRIGWVTVEVVDAGSRRLAPAGLDLYGGLPGIGLFLSYLAAAVPDAWARDLAVRVAEEVVHRCREAAWLPASRRPGLEGGPGAVYHLAHAAAVHGRPGLAEFARDALLTPPPPAAAPDVLEGAAGTLLSALALHAALPSARALDVARTAAERLLEADLTEPGFGYGASGAAVALARLHALAPDARYASRARALVAAEESPGTDTGWCQGATGSALARLELRDGPVYESIPVRQRLERSLEELAVLVRNDPPPLDDSLCHGTSGHLELLTALDGSLADAPLVSTPASSRPAGPWRTALPAPAPGLLAGLAGVGYGLLRSARPDVVPSVLVLAPPRGRP